MKKIYRFAFSLFALSMLFSSCDPSDFGDINRDPNNPSIAYANYMFTQAQRYLYYFVTGNATNGYDPWQQAWPGYLSESKNNQYGPLGTTTSYSTTSTFYLYVLKNLQYIIDMNEDEEQREQTNVSVLGTSANQIAASKTLMAFYYMHITDIMGPVVITEALQGQSDDNWTPKYDTQKEAYTILDEMLKEAYSLFDESGTLDSSADAMFGGDVVKWKKFNASVRMLLAIKLADVDPDTGKSRFATAYKDGGMTEVADGLYHTFDDLNWNMLYYWNSLDYSGAGYNWVPNMYIVEQMKEFQDDRMFAYFEIEGYKGTRDEELYPRGQYSSFYGIPYGLMSNSDVNAWATVCCCINSSMLTMDASLPVIPTARVLLVEAEAACRGWIEADAKTLYNAGIASSFEQWGVSGAESYCEKKAVKYDSSKGLEQIAIQRWIAGYLADGVEAWSDWRRLDIPKLYVGPAAKNDGYTHYPYRLAFYSAYDPALNPDNYAEAIKDLSSGKDDVNSRVWWDTADNEEGVLTDEQCTPPSDLVHEEVWNALYEGDYTYTVIWNDVDEGLILYQNDEDPTSYKIENWGYGVDFCFTMDDDNKIYIDEQETGYDHSTYGTVYVADIPTWGGYSWDEYPSYYDPDEDTYYFLLIYYCDAGYFGYDYEWFVPTGSASSTYVKTRSAMSSKSFLSDKYPMPRTSFGR